MLLNQREYLTIIKIINPVIQETQKQQIKNNQLNINPKTTKNLVAWIVCRLFKDNLSLENTVNIKFVYYFQKGFNIKNYLVTYFKEIGYSVIK